MHINKYSNIEIFNNQIIAEITCFMPPLATLECNTNDSSVLMKTLISVYCSIQSMSYTKKQSFRVC